MVGSRTLKSLPISKSSSCGHQGVFLGKEVGQRSRRRMGSQLEALAGWLSDLKQATLSEPQFLHL